MWLTFLNWCYVADKVPLKIAMLAFSALVLDSRRQLFWHIFKIIYRKQKTLFEVLSMIVIILCRRVVFTLLVIESGSQNADFYIQILFGEKVYW